MKIGFFDSGVGGLGIFEETRKLLPNLSMVYLADTANCPYGEKTVEEIKKICFENTSFLIGKGVGIVVVACNSASVSVLRWLREQFPNTAIVGVVPVVKTLSEISKTKKVAILATKRTIESDYLHDLVGKFLPKEDSFEVGYYACGELVDLVESGDRKGIRNVLDKCLNGIKDNGVDAVALGCTHFPFAKQEIEEYLGENIKVLDSNGAVARQIKRIVSGSMYNAVSNRPEYLFYTSGDAEKVSKVASELLNREISFRQK